jgi:hypothetical protein
MRLVVIQMARRSFGSDGDRFERAEEIRSGASLVVEFDFTEGGGFEAFVVVRADAEADVERLLEGEAKTSAGGIERLAFGGDGHGDVLAALFEAEPFRGFSAGLDFVCASACGGAILKGGQSVAVQGGIGVGGIGVEGLADNQNGFAMGIAIGSGD